ncbi:uncharacterized protein K489DRAFT_385490 [Dissoconium aciculare CBS 342.82]|uniref:Uncharacterized protein n=1 Tax=Dissoconium aciculare CBS 342.82 TaxID=1314786 RepID=A0A6J3LRA5_9PEZI|nr:uncharacterized protein K489DRAFT_385490 [Dissoconium aciculare CBS 342.82]KAF1817809.1 hypothetical protein K489DRAFT_385490 [Dissoconium aciculare CBS 342.82]
MSDITPTTIGPRVLMTFKKINTKEDARLAAISTSNDPISAEDVITGSRSGVMMGAMSEETARHISSDHKALIATLKEPQAQEESSSFAGHGHTLEEGKR